MAKSPAPGTIEETFIRKRQLPAEAEIPEFWDYLESLTPERWNQHVLYIYREDPQGHPCF